MVPTSFHKCRRREVEVERLEAASYREPGLAAEALRALTDLARGDAPEPAHDARPVGRQPRGEHPAEREGVHPAERESVREGVHEGVRERVPNDTLPSAPAGRPSRRLPHWILLAVAAAPVLACTWLFVVLVLSWL